MEQRTRTALLVAVIGILAIGLAAATLTSTVDPESGGGGGGFGNETADDEPGFEQPEPESTDSDESEDVSPAVERLLFVLLALGLFATLAYMFIYRKRAAAIILVLTGMSVILWLLLIVGDFGAAEEFGVGNGDGIFGFGSDDGTDGVTGSGESQSALGVALAVFVVLLVLVVMYLGRSVSIGDDETAGTDAEDGDDIGAVGAIAGETADRIESAGGSGEHVDNEVYRAYREMVEHLDVPYEASRTPGEFAAAATERGMAAEDVAELTELFEEVRYGGYTPTAEREKQAVDVLRRIERRYGDA